MKKFFFSLALLCLSSSAWAATCLVGSSDTVQDRIDNYTCDTIALIPGLNHTETFIVSRNVTITTLQFFGTALNKATISGDATMFPSPTITVDSGITLNLKKIKVKDGSALQGGAVYVDGGTLTTDNVDFLNNEAQDGGAIYNNGGNLTIANSYFLHNEAADDGGAIHSYDGGSWTVNNTIFEENHAIPTTVGSNGGGIYQAGDDYLTITTSEFWINDANDGGAIYVGSASSLTVDDVSFASNVANDDGGALYHAGPAAITDAEFIDNTADTGGAIRTATQSSGTYQLDVLNTSFETNSATTVGGAIYASYASIRLTSSEFDSNSADLAGAVRAGGGSTYNTILIDDCLFDTNLASGSNGGAVYLGDSGTTIEDSEFNGNSTPYNGGAVYYNSDELSLTVARSHFYLNEAYTYGGGIYFDGNDLATVSISETFFDANFADNYGGGMALVDAAQIRISNNTITDNLSNIDGGGVYTYSSSDSQIINSTIARNDARFGGAIYNRSMTLDLKHNTLYYNTGISAKTVYQDATATLKSYNSIIRGNAPGDGKVECLNGSYLTFGTNLNTHATQCGTMTVSDPVLSGPTTFTYGEYYTPSSTGSAAGTASTTYCETTDQTGVTRMSDSDCDVGAKEL